MTTIFRKMLQDGSLVNYMDNFAILGETKQQLQECTIKFLEIADKHNLYFKRSKCDFNASQISMLGTVIGNGKATMEKEKVEAIQNWETPTMIKDVEKFLRFHQFLPTIYQELQHDCSTVKCAERRKRGESLEMGN